MCYSAMVEQNAKKLGLKFGARVETDIYAAYFERRLKGHKLTLGQAMEGPFIDSSDQDFNSNIAAHIEEWHEKQTSSHETELAKQELRLERANKVLAQKVTKKAENDQRISTKKIGSLATKIKMLQERKNITRSADRIFPFHFLSMLILTETGERIIRPFRYHLRPSGQPATFDRKYGGCYNARRDNLISPFWKPIFGKRHGIIVVRRFYENVAAMDYHKNINVNFDPGEKTNIVLEFSPEGVEEMLIPAIWDINLQATEAPLYSCALITDEPPPEILATGHDRCPIFLKANNIENWLNPGKTLDHYYEVLKDKVTPHYTHKIMNY